MKIEEAKAVISTYDFSEDNEDNEFKEALKVAIRSLEAWQKVDDGICDLDWKGDPTFWDGVDAVSEIIKKALGGK